MTSLANWTDSENESSIYNYCDTSNLETIYWYWFYSDIIYGLLSITGNSLVIFLVFLEPALRTSLNVLLVNMALSDIFLPSLDLLGVIFIYLGIGGNLSRTSEQLLCKLLPFVLNISAAVSVQSLVIIAFNRFYAVMYPMRAKLSKRKKSTYVIIFVTWFTACAIFCPYPYFYKSANEDGLINCYLTLKGNSLHAYDIFISAFLRSIPFVLMTALYTVIIIKVRRQTVPGNPIPSFIRRRKQNDKLTYMCFTVMLMFFCSWGVYEILYMVSSYVGGSYYCNIQVALDILYPFSSMSSAVNPIIYFIYCSNFRLALTKVFRKGDQTYGKGSSISGHYQIALRHIKLNKEVLQRGLSASTVVSDAV